MSYTVKFSSKREKYVTRRFDVTKITVKYQSAEAWNKYLHECMESGVTPTDFERANATKVITVDGKMTEAEAAMYVTAYRDKYLSNALPNGVKVEYAKEAYKISTSDFRKFGIRITEAEAEEAEAEEAEEN